MSSSKCLTCLQTVCCATVRTLGFTCLGDVQINLGVAVPQLHVCLGARAEHATLSIQIFGGQFDDGICSHVLCLSRAVSDVCP